MVISIGTRKAELHALKKNCELRRQFETWKSDFVPSCVVISQIISLVSQVGISLFIETIHAI